jgi:hypothetical protein
MGRVLALVLVASFVTACADPPAGPGGGAGTPTESPSPSSLPNTTCENVQAGDPNNFPDFVEVELESQGGVDRISFLFEPDAGAPDQPPLHFINFTEQLVTEGEGAPVDVEGEAFLVVAFQAVGVDLSTEQPEEVYTGPDHFRPRFGTIREVRQLGDFEGQVSWGLGLAAKQCFVLEAEADRITLEFASA